MPVSRFRVATFPQFPSSRFPATTIQQSRTRIFPQNAKSVYVDAQGQIGGIVTTSFTGNEANGGATLNYDGSTTGENDAHRGQRL